MRDILYPTKLPAHICMMKWFERSSLCSETLAVCTPLGQELLGVVQAAVIPQQQIEMLLRGVLGEIDQRQTLVPFKISDLLCEATTIRHENIRADRQICALDGGPFIRDQGHIYFENTGETLFLEFTLDAANRLKICTEVKDAPNTEALSGPRLQGYFYVPLPAGGPLRIRLQGHVFGLTPNYLLQKIVLHSDGKFSPQAPLYKNIAGPEFTADYSFSGHQRWPGLSEHRFAFYKWKLCRVGW